MIAPFYRHGIFSDRESMDSLVEALGRNGGFSKANNECYEWSKPIVQSGLPVFA